MLQNAIFRFVQTDREPFMVPNYILPLLTYHIYVLQGVQYIYLYSVLKILRKRIFWRHTCEKMTTKRKEFSRKSELKGLLFLNL